MGTRPRARAIVALERIERAILLLRGHRVMLDAELASLYDVSVKRLNEQVRRNRERFPQDFMFQLSADEAASLRSHFATLKSGSQEEINLKSQIATSNDGVSFGLFCVKNSLVRAVRCVILLNWICHQPVS